MSDSVRNDQFAGVVSSTGDSLVTFEHSRSVNRDKLTVRGELKHGNSDLVYSKVVELFESGIKEILLDFTALGYVDTTGLQSLVKIYKHVMASEGLKFKVLVERGELWDILHTCRFDKFIDITDDPAVWENPW